MTEFQLRFDLSEISRWADAYMNTPGNNAEETLEDIIVPKVHEARYLDKETFLLVCHWKSPRPKKHYERNEPEVIREATTLALSASTEEMRIGVLTLLHGVNLPMASVFLHWFHRDRYPILDYRALESLGIKKKDQPNFDFKFWWEYTRYCRELADRAPGKPSMRKLDRALWEFSKQNPYL